MILKSIAVASSLILFSSVAVAQTATVTKTQESQPPGVRVTITGTGTIGLTTWQYRDGDCNITVREKDEINDIFTSPGVVSYELCPPTGAVEFRLCYINPAFQYTAWQSL